MKKKKKHSSKKYSGSRRKTKDKKKDSVKQDLQQDVKKDTKDTKKDVKKGAKKANKKEASLGRTIRPRPSTPRTIPVLFIVFSSPLSFTPQTAIFPSLPALISPSEPSKENCAISPTQYTKFPIIRQ